VKVAFRRRHSIAIGYDGAISVRFQRGHHGLLACSILSEQMHGIDDQYVPEGTEHVRPWCQVSSA
jgi:hypothetical protein